MKDCLFCEIVSGKVPSKIIYEDEYCIAFDDIEPEAPVHTLIVPKHHFEDLQDNVPEELMGHVYSIVPKIAQLKGVDKSGYRTVINTGSDAAQTVRHLHIHLLGGIQMGRFTFENSQRLKEK